MVGRKVPTYLLGWGVEGVYCVHMCCVHFGRLLISGSRFSSWFADVLCFRDEMTRPWNRAVIASGRGTRFRDLTYWVACMGRASSRERLLQQQNGARASRPDPPAVRTPLETARTRSVCFAFCLSAVCNWAWFSEPDSEQAVLYFCKEPLIPPLKFRVVPVTPKTNGILESTSGFGSLQKKKKKNSDWISRFF